jgi:hypothetical protein
VISYFIAHNLLTYSLDSPYISLRRKSALKEQERRTPPRSAHVSFGATVCCAFKDILQARLPNVYCEVSDMSGSFLHYKLLGPKRYLYRYVKADKTGKRWEAKIYELNLRKSTLENLRNANGIHRLYRVSNEDVKLVSLGSYFDSEKAASSAWDQALKNRDNINPFEQDFKKALNRELTHMFRIYIVSESFHNQNQRERLMSVYEVSILHSCKNSRYERLCFFIRYFWMHFPWKQHVVILSILHQDLKSSLTLEIK